MCQLPEAEVDREMGEELVVTSVCDHVEYIVAIHRGVSCLLFTVL